MKKVLALLLMVAASAATIALGSASAPSSSQMSRSEVRSVTALPGAGACPSNTLFNLTVVDGSNQPGLYRGNASNNCVAVGNSGDTVGPASSTDNAIARFDSTTGKLLQNSSVTVDDSGNVASPGAFTFTQGTLAASAPFINHTATWSAGGVTFTNFKSDVTDSASASASLLMDLRVGGSSRFKVRKDGALFFGDFSIVNDGSGEAAFRNFAGSSLINVRASRFWAGRADGSLHADVGQAGEGVFSASSAGGYCFSSTANSNGARDVCAERSEANVLKLTNGSTGGGTLRVGDPGAKPTCNSSRRGMIWLEEGAAGVADTFEVCSKDAADAYAWRALY